jgi:hypothetical protein
MAVTRCPNPPRPLGGHVDGGLVGGDEDVEAVRDELPGECSSDPGGRSSDNGNSRGTFVCSHRARYPEPRPPPLHPRGCSEWGWVRLLMPQHVDGSGF